MSVIMRRPVNLTLVRHGETNHNVKKIIQGHTDAILSVNGESQAETLGKHIADHKFTAAFSSDLSRAHQTAQLILKHSKQANPTPIVIDRRLRERCFGEMEGQHFSLFLEEADKLGVDPAIYTPKGAETVEDVAERARDFFRELCDLADTDAGDTGTDILEAQADEHILVVSHGGFLKHLLKFLHTSTDSFMLRNFEPAKGLANAGNTAVTRLTISPLYPDGEEARQRRSITFSDINDLSHLKELEVSPSWDSVLKR